MMESIGRTLLAVALSAILVGSIFVTAFTMSNYAYAQVADDPAASDAGSSDAGSSDPSSSNSTSESTSTNSSSSSESDNPTNSENSNVTSTNSNSTTTAGSESSAGDETNSTSTESQTDASSSSNSTSSATTIGDNRTNTQDGNGTESSSEDNSIANTTSADPIPPSLTTDKQDYSPHEIAYIRGVDFEPETSYNLFVFRGDGWIVKSDGEQGYDTIVTDVDGNFVHPYELPSVNGEWMVLIYESSDTELYNILASVTFDVTAPTLSTDKFDYDPTETVTVFGNGFGSEQGYDIVIERPDGSIIKGDGTFTEGFDSIASDSQGRFTYSYILNGIPGNYMIYAYRSSDLSHQDLIARGGFNDANSGPKFPGTATSATWSNPSSGLASDNICASSAGNNRFIDITNFGFTSSDIPVGAIITSIQVEVDGAGSGNGNTQIQLISSGATAGSSQSFNLAGSCATSTFATITAPTDPKWGTSLGQPEITSTGFGVRITQSSGSGTRSIDSVRITVSFELGSISGMKFEDHNGNGIKDSSDQGLAGWTIFIDANNNGVLNGGEASTVTAADGTYSFTNLAEGTYRIREVLQSGWTQTTVNPADITISSSTFTFTGRDFGNFQMVSISGTKFNDINGNGAKDGGEAGLPGWTIQLDKSPFGSVDQTTTTGAGGVYSFANLGPGTYRISEVSQSGWTQTSANPSDITAQSGSNIGNINFGNFQLGTISGMKFNDLNNNGVKDSGEPGLSGWTIQLDKDANGSVDQTTVTASGGTYSFTGLGLGTYRIREVVQSGWVQTSANPADIVVSSSGTAAASVDFGNFQLASISGQKFRDKDGNGLKDTGDNGLNGWVMFIDSNNNGALDSGEPTDATGSGGDYEFSGLSAGTYIIREVLQSGWLQTAPASGFYSVTITTSGQTVSERDFGNFQLITISGMKFNDLDGNGELDLGEVGLAGWTINLDLGADGTVDDTTSTAADGTYSFSGLGPGTYRVREVQQTGWSQTTTNPADIVAESGVDVANVNFGNQLQVGSISGMKFEDHNGNGIKDSSDQGLEGWTIFIDADNSGTLNAGDTSTTTDSDGNFQFEDLLPGTYNIMEVEQSGWTQTAPAAGFYSTIVTPGADSGGNDFGNFEQITISGTKFEDSNGDGDKAGDIGLAGWTIFIDANNNGLNDVGESSTTTASDGTFSLSGIGPGTYKVREEPQSGWAQTTSDPDHIVTSSGIDVANVDFGNFQLGTISGIKFEDEDGEGDKDLSDTGLEGWTIYIDSNNNGNLDAGEPTSTTAPSGAFNFAGLGVGTYIVREETQSGWTQTFPAAGSYTVMISTSGSVVSDKDFGNFKNVAISGQKFEDQDGNGVKDSGEPGLEGWTISLSGPVALSTTTDSSGEYSFANLGPGTYLISETLMSDWIQTFPNSPDSYTVVATSGDDVLSQDFGNFQLFDIVGYKYDDINGDGNLADRVGLAGWTIYVDMNGNDQLDSGEPSDTTDDNGQYTLADLGPSALGKMVREEAQSGYAQTSSPTANPVSTTSGDDLTTGFDFGNFELISISGNKFEDTDGDGSRDLSETASVAGVSIQLDVGADGSVDDTTSTDSNGDYSFSGLGPGVYRVREVSPSGWMQTTADPSDISAQSGSDVSDVDFGNFELFEISGMKFEDVNGDGVKDSGDNGLAGWTINLEKDGSPYASTLTGADGSYSFADLGPGEYTISEALESGWAQTYPASPGTYTFNGVSGSDVSDQDFGNFELISISGLKFEDHDGDGSQDVGDQGLEGWTINLDKGADGSTDQSTVTAGDGTYSFSDLGPGTYRIREVQQAGWTQTTDDPSDIAAESGTDASGIDFGNFENIVISGIKFEDHDGDGVQDPEDQGLEGWTIQLDIDADGSVDESETTDVSGGYSFSGLGPGTYRIREVTQPDWTQTTADPSDTVSWSGTDVNGVNFGNFQLFDISGIKFEDHNGDGVADSGDQGLQGWTVNLEKDGSPLASTTTDANGEYSFADLGPGEYRIAEILQSGWTQTFPSSSSYEVTGSSGIDATSKDFGNFKNFKISGMKFEDHDGDGTQDSGDQGLQDWSIFLDSNGNNAKDPSEPSMLTDSNGNYEFTDLGPGTYSVREELNSGWTQTTTNPDAISGSSGVDVSGINFGNFENFAITGNKFEDTDGDGVRDLGETTGVGGVTIQLDKGADDTADATTSTDSNGDYSFSGLGPGTYRVREMVPAGWMQTTANPTDVTASSGTNVAGKDFGNFQLVTISGKKYHDLDGDKTDDSGADPGLSGWTMELRNSVNVVVATAVTDSNGNYQFASVGPGSYAVTEILQSGWHQTFPAKYPLPPGSHSMTTSSGINVGGKDFGNILARSITGFYQPVDMNGVYNIIQNGRAVPLKFDVFIGGTEQTSVSEVVGQTATAKLVQCTSSAPIDDVEVTNTGATALRYDGTAGQFIQNWKTPTGAGKCYAVTITIIDGSSITAYFKTK